MASVNIILGKSGTGKSTSIKTLDPHKTIVVNVLHKRLPFKGSNIQYSKENNNLFELSNYKKIIDCLIYASEKRKEVNTVIIDDAIYVMRKEYFAKANVTGYAKYVEFGQHFQDIIQTCESLRDDLHVFLIMHSEDVISDGVVKEYKVSTVGKLIDSTYNPMEVVPIVLYSDVNYDENGKANYGFYTHRTIVGQTIIPAKSPDGMFEEDFIPNDLNLVIDKMDKYFN